MAQVPSTRHPLGIAALAAFAVAGCCSGCALVDARPDGTTRIVGLVWLDLAARPSAGRQAGEAMRVRSLGIGITSGRPTTAMTVGYSDSLHALINDDSCASLGAFSKGPDR